jgi:hypothetical protein
MAHRLQEDLQKVRFRLGHPLEGKGPQGFQNLPENFPVSAEEEGPLPFHPQGPEALQDLEGRGASSSST